MKMWIALIAACGLALPLFAADDATPAPTETPQPKAAQAQPADTTAPADKDAQTQPSAEQVLNELLKKRAENPLIEPARPAEDTASRLSPDKTVTLGPAPNLAPGKLKREGSFVLSRRGRMAHAPGGSTGWMFTFDADTDGLQDPPMFLMPCQLLEDMEQVVEQHPDGTTFLISGQVYVYHGANYLMPTLMKIAPDRGNLQP